MNNRSISKKVKVGTLFNHIPYALIPGLGTVFNKYKKDRAGFGTMSPEAQKQFIFNKVYKLVAYSLNNIPFYKDYYRQKGFSLDQLHKFEDMERIPIVTKKDLMAVPLEYRSAKRCNRSLANTGGSFGMPLSFYKEWKQKIKETSYYHLAWSSLGYRQSDIRLQLVGRAEMGHINYDITRNRLTADVYMPFDLLLEELKVITKDSGVAYLQGYPSVLYELALYLKTNPVAFDTSCLKGKVKGVFLNSEYPYPLYRSAIEEVFNVKTIASYGHTEGCILAFDFGKGDYLVEQSYGFAEAVERDGEFHLVGTSYDNYASPFIRYDTADTIDEAQIEDGLLQSFKMTGGGRTGQYVLDKNGKRISLTGLLFGKHHLLFNHCSQIQISQREPGIATIYYVAKDGSLQGRSPQDLFSADGIDMDFDFVRLDQPIRTKAGKVLLLVNPQESNGNGT